MITHELDVAAAFDELADFEGNRIRVDGRAVDSGTGWSAESNFTFFIDIALAGGAITVTATAPSVDTDVDLEWWVWLLSLGLGALFGGIVGVIVAAIVLAVVEAVAVAEGIVNDLVSGGIGGALGGIPAIPLGPIGGGITLNTVVLDDLELRCSIIRSLAVPVKTQGSHGSLGRFSADLDTGAVTAAELAKSDLTWRPNHSLKAAGPAGLTITGTAYGSLTPVQVSRMALTGNTVPAASIPLAFPPGVFLLPHDNIVFGMRTSDGRLAKVEAWRSITEAGALHLNWVTYDTPVPRLDISQYWTVLERGAVTEYITSDCSFCRSAPVRWCVLIEAVPRLMPFPIDYQWCLRGTVIEDDEGEVPSHTGPIGYKLKGRRLMIETDMGQDVDCELCVSAIDGRGQEQFTCIRLSRSGIERHCRKCIPADRRYDISILSAAPEYASWRPLVEPGWSGAKNDVLV